MFTPYYREGIPSPRVSQADFALSLAGAIVAHAAEMSAWRKGDIEDQRAALTRCVDHGRRAYGFEARSIGADAAWPSRSTTTTSCRMRPVIAATGRRGPPRGADIEGLRRDRDQLFAEALVRLRAGERHWPTPEEEERLIAPERARYMPEAALEVSAILQRFIVEAPLTTRPNREISPGNGRDGHNLCARCISTSSSRMLRDVCGREAAGARPGLQAGHRLLHDVAAQQRLAAGAERSSPTGREWWSGGPRTGRARQDHRTDTQGPSLGRPALKQPGGGVAGHLACQLPRAQVERSMPVGWRTRRARDTQQDTQKVAWDAHLVPLIRARV